MENLACMQDYAKKTFGAEPQGVVRDFKPCGFIR
jgi:hypothetical protein